MTSPMIYLKKKKNCVESYYFFSPMSLSEDQREMCQMNKSLFCFLNTIFFHMHLIALVEFNE